MDNQQIMSMLKPVDSLTPEEEKEVEDYKVYSAQPEYDPDYLASNKDIIFDSMAVLRGPSVYEMTEEEVIDDWLYVNRALTIGNLPNTFDVHSIVKKASDKDLETLGKGFLLFEHMPYKNMPPEEKKKAWLDYGQALLLDPANYVGLGVGKLVGLGARGTSLAGTGARLSALRAPKEVAEAAFNHSLKKASARSAKKIEERAAQTKSLSKFGRLGTKEAVLDGVSALTTDAAISAGAEWLYQDIRVKTGVQPEMIMDRVALAALGTGVIGGLAYTSNMFRGTSGYDPKTSLPKVTPDKKVVFPKFTEGVKKRMQDSPWKEKVARGVELEDTDVMFWRDMTSAMTEALVEDGIVPPHNYKTTHGNYGNWLADMVAAGDPVDGRRFLQEFMDETGIRIKGLEGENSLRVFSDNFAKHYSLMGSGLSDFSVSLRKTRGKDLTIRDALKGAVKLGDEPTVEKGVMRPFLDKLAEKLPASGAKIAKTFMDTQSNLIRMIVANPATTRLNLVGYAFSALENTGVDITQAVLHGTSGSVGKIFGAKNANESLRLARAHVGSVIQRVKNTLDLNTTYDQYLALAQMRPEQMKQITNIINGGVENLDELIKKQGYDPDDSFLNVGVGAFTDLVQMVSFVQTQDALTKSQEFIYQLDKKLRLYSDRTLAQTLSHPDAAKLLNSNAYIVAEAEAVYETGRAVYGTSFRTTPVVGKIAAVIEDFRQLPVIGMTIPFGRFFNNVAAKTVDYSFAGSFFKFAGDTFIKRGAVYGNRTHSDMLIRGAIGWTTVGLLVDQQNEWIDLGLGTFEYIDPESGAIKDGKYTYPLSAFLATSRVAAYGQRGEEPPEGLMQEVSEYMPMLKGLTGFFNEKEEMPERVVLEGFEFVFGQLTRDFNDATASVVEVTAGMFSSGGANREQSLKEFYSMVFGSPMTNVVSAATRWLEPVNIIRQTIENTDIKDARDGDRTINEATRYISSWVSTSNVPAYTVEEGKVGPSLTKYVTDRTGRLTNIERISNVIGEQAWRLNQFTESAEANNLYEKYFNSLLEEKATKLWNSDKFQEANLVNKRKLWSEVKQQAGKTVMDTMSQNVSGDSRLALILKLARKPQDELNLALSSLEGLKGKRLDELTESELIHVDQFIDYQFDIYKQSQ